MGYGSWWRPILQCIASEMVRIFTGNPVSLPIPASRPCQQWTIHLAGHLTSLTSAPQRQPLNFSSSMSTIYLQHLGFNHSTTAPHLQPLKSLASKAPISPTVGRLEGKSGHESRLMCILCLSAYLASIRDRNEETKTPAARHGMVNATVAF